MMHDTSFLIDRYAVIGHPIAHSQSPYLHTAFAKQCHQSLVYEAKLSPLDGFDSMVVELMQAGWKGANVTVPFKEEAYRLSHQVSARAELSQSVNTLTFTEVGNIIGDNTDGVGLITDMRINACMTLRNKRILLLGAGGAARGVIAPLLREQPRVLVLANRTLSKAEALAASFETLGQIVVRDYSQLTEPFDIIINATAASLEGAALPIPPIVYKKETWAYDMLYGKDMTPFLAHAASYGARIRDGWGMLVEQAAESFWIWRGIKPDTSPFLRQGT